MTAFFMPLHVAPDAEGLATPRNLALPWFFSRMGICMYFQGARPGEGFAACAADVSILIRRIRRRRRVRKVMMVLPSGRGVRDVLSRRLIIG
jgi:hypothetical protein